MGLFGKKDQSNPYRFKMRERLIAFGQDFYIENVDGLRCYWVDAKPLRVRDTILFKDLQGQVFYKIQDRIARVRETMVIEDGSGGHVATVKKAMISPIHHRFDIDIEGQPSLNAKGKILEHEYKIRREDNVIATVSKKWIRVRETYTVDIDPGENVLLVLAITTAIDAISDPG